jgi:mannose-6-phosphate isomerase-like protein (cupin superfamily)
LNQENIPTQKSTSLRKNNSQPLQIKIDQNKLDNIFLINGNSFINEDISNSDLLINPNSYYMVINNGENTLTIKYNQNISNHKIIYDPFKFEFSNKVNFEPDFFTKRYNVPEGYIETLPKWYSFKFTYPEYNLIFIKPEYGLSIQTHKFRNESWEILEGRPIIINKDKVYYFVENGIIFNNPINAYHCIINPNKEPDKFVIIKEKWNGKFDEDDIKRVFNPNHYS